MNLGAGAIADLRLGANGAAKAYLGAVEVWSSIDPDLAQFIADSGATDTAGLADLVAYVKAQSLWSNFSIYPMKSAQNAGSGSTVYGLGGLTTNDMTLVNSPTWGSGGIDFDSTSSQYASASDFLSGGDLSVFVRATLDDATPSSAKQIASQDNGGVARAWYIVVLTDGAVRLLRSNDGSNIEAYDTASATAATADTCYVAKWTEGGGREFWVNKSAESLTLGAGSAKTSLVNSSNDVLIGASQSSSTPGFFQDGTQVATAFVNGASLTTTQRETITDLINAL